MLKAQPTESESYAETLCRDYGWEPERIFCNQYLIAPSNQTQAGLPSWQSITIGTWTLWHDPGLPVCPIRDLSGQTVGLLCGLAIGPDHKVAHTALDLSFDADQADAQDRFEDILLDVRGRYIALLRLCDQTYLYCDPAADMGAVYDKDTRRVGLSVPVVLNRPFQREKGVTRPNLIQGLTPLRAGMTPDAGVRRLFPNHRLDLATFSVRRFWPKTAPTIARDETEQQAIAADIAARLSQNIAALITHTRSAIPISGGYDSRIILSLAASQGKDPEFCYTHRTNWISAYDAIQGQKIADHLGIPYRFLDAVALSRSETWAQAANKERTLRFVRSGFSEPKVKAPAALAPLLVPDIDLVLRGNVMEMLTGRFHESAGLDDIEAAYKLIWGRQPAKDEERISWQCAYSRWLADLTPNMPEKTGLDLAFLELLYSHGMAVVLQSLPKGFYINPFTDRRLIGQTMRVPSETRKEGGLSDMILSHGRSLPNLDPPITLGRRDSRNEASELAEFLEHHAVETELYKRKE